MKRLIVVLLLLCTFAAASEKMTVVGYANARHVLTSIPGESHWDAGELQKSAVTVIGFQHASGASDNYTLCGIDLRLELMAEYEMTLTKDDSDNINIGTGSYAYRGACWMLQTAKRTKVKKS